jgi:cell wall assembly regulator SMI1
MGLDRFIAMWMSPDYPPAPVTEAGLSSVEQRFGFSFPPDYRNEVCRHGLASPTIALLDAIVAGGLDMADLSELLDPEEMIASTESWHDMGLPDDMVAFASDCSGNLFCFRTVGGGAVFLFDHDFETAGEVAPSFAQWIDSFCKIGAQ